MKQFLRALLIVASSASFSYADQLAYISKLDADQAAEVISKLKHVYLFCGCCSVVEPVRVKPVNVYTRHTGYENYWEVIIEYKGKDGNIVENALDLAYVWKKKRKKYQTIGEMLGLEHDPCVYLPDWKIHLIPED